MGCVLIGRLRQDGQIGRATDESTGNCRGRTVSHRGGSWGLWGGVGWGDSNPHLIENFVFGNFEF